MSGSVLFVDSERWLKDGVFARHETFCPRYGWLKKGFEGVRQDPHIFERDDAIEELGVGKNMVASIRFWCIAFHIIEPLSPTGQKRLSGPMRVTEFGENLLGEHGWDPFLEDPASLWLLHWKLFTPPVYALAWSFIFNTPQFVSFTMKDLTQTLEKRREGFEEMERYAGSSLEKDASCFIRMYAPSDRKAMGEVECPFTQLGLLNYDESVKGFRFNIENKPTLPDKVLLSACLEYAGVVYNSSLKSISLGRLAYDFNSPGVVFKISETELGNRLENIVDNNYGIYFTESQGIRQLQWKTLEGLAKENLADYYAAKL